MKDALDSAPSGPHWICQGDPAVLSNWRLVSAEDADRFMEEGAEAGVESFRCLWASAQGGKPLVENVDTLGSRIEPKL